MGIRFRCHHCEHELHVKDFQAGRRGRCPECRGTLRIPEEDAEYSSEVDQESSSSASDLESASVAVTAEPDKRKQGANPRQGKRMVSQDARDEPLTATRPPTSSTAAKPKPMKSRAASQESKNEGENIANASDPGAPASRIEDEAEPRSTSDTSGPSDSNRQPPKALLDSPQATWYVRPATGGQYGPADNKAFTQWLHEHRIGRDALVWRDGWPEWRSAETVFDDYFDQQPATPTPLPIPQAHIGPAPSRIGTATDRLAESQSLSERNRLVRRRKRRRNYVISIAVLAVLMLSLVVALAVVLMRSQSTIAL